MSMHKEEVLELVRQLPDEVDVEEVIYRLYLREKLAAAEADIAAGRTLSPEEVRQQARTWRQYDGRNVPETTYGTSTTSSRETRHAQPKRWLSGC